MKLKLCTFSLILVYNIFFPISIQAQWSNDPSQNLQVSPWGMSPQAVTDGAGGVYILWHVNSFATPQYLQRVNKYGYICWEWPLVIQGEWGGTGFYPYIIEDGSTGALVAFSELQVSGEFPYPGRGLVTRVDSTGSFVWDSVNVRVSLTDSSYGAVGMVPDGEGGAIVVFIVEFLETIPLYVQHISSSGQRLWGDSGVFVTDVVSSAAISLVSDGAGGVILHYWEDDFKFSRIDSNGNILGTTNSTMFYSRMIPDRNGGAIMSGTRYSGGDYNSVANRLSFDGIFLWGNEGITLADSTGIQGSGINIALNEDETATFVWRKPVNSLNNIFTQRLTENGQIVWNENILVSLYPSEKVGGQVLPSDSGSNIYIWADSRNSNGDPFGSDIYTQKISSTQERLWPYDDIQITYSHPSHMKIATDQQNGAIVVWSDEPLYGIFAQQISKNGILGEVIDSVSSIEVENENKFPEVFELYQNYPNPFNPSTVIRYQLSAISNVELIIYNALSQEIKLLFSGQLPAGNYQSIWDGRDNFENQLSSGVYFYRLKINNNKIKTKKMLLIR
ncbi:T9SS type A sorting domain-containing protein [candidate division KSB1 bacterium]|nr:T9SS type A sorting domain-containing protein [candidate division KSB1 bacterium]